MPRAIWSGAISFGLVNVPVKLYSAVSRKTVRFHQLNGDTQSRIQQKRVDAQTGEEVPYEHIVKGYEISPDRYVVIEPEELEALDPKKTRTIDIQDFVDEDEIDPIFYDHPYYLVPGAGAEKAYRLLLEAMEEAGKVAIAHVVIRSKESLVAIRPAGDVLTMSTMLFADEVVPVDRLDELPAGRQGHEDHQARARHGRAAHRLADGRLRAREVPRRLPRARARPDRAQGRGRGDRGRRGAGRGGQAGARPDGRARGLDQGGEGRGRGRQGRRQAARASALRRRPRPTAPVQEEAGHAPEGKAGSSKSASSKAASSKK